MLGSCLDNVRKSRPLIHNITNYVTVNDVANIILACGASPVMSDEPKDVEELTSVCSGLNINIGTLNEKSIEAMFIAGRRANELGHPVLLDPVGAGATSLRTGTALKLLEELDIAVLKGNISEIKALALGVSSTKGVDANITDAVTEEKLSESIELINDFAKRVGCMVAVTGAIDLVSDGSTCYVIRNGEAEMESITGTGCQLAGMMTAFISANKANMLEAAAASVAAMGLAGEFAKKNMLPADGNVSYRGRIIDAIYNMNGKMLDEGAKYELR